MSSVPISCCFFSDKFFSRSAILSVWASICSLSTWTCNWRLSLSDCTFRTFSSYSGPWRKTNHNTFIKSVIIHFSITFVYFETASSVLKQTYTCVLFFNVCRIGTTNNVHLLIYKWNSNLVHSNKHAKRVICLQVFFKITQFSVLSCRYLRPPITRRVPVMIMHVTKETTRWWTMKWATSIWIVMPKPSTIAIKIWVTPTPVHKHRAATISLGVNTFMSSMEILQWKWWV